MSTICRRGMRQRKNKRKKEQSKIRTEIHNRLGWITPKEWIASMKLRMIRIKVTIKITYRRCTLRMLLKLGTMNTLLSFYSCTPVESSKLFLIEARFLHFLWLHKIMHCKNVMIQMLCFALLYFFLYFFSLS